MKRIVVCCITMLMLSHCATTQTGDQGAAPIKKVKGNYKLGVVLPLSGKYKIYGDSVLHGIECAAGVVPPCTSPIRVDLVVKDSKGDPNVAATAVEELVKQDQVIAILGPLMSKEIEAAAQKAQELSVPLVSLSQKDGITDIGNFVFRVALNSSSQVQTLVDYAVKQKGLKRFGVMYPRNTYGETFRMTFSDVVTKAGGQVVSEKAYGEEVVNIVDATAQQQRDGVSQGPKSGLSTDGTYYGAGGKGTSGSDVTAGVVSARPRIPSITGVDAVFIPDSYRAIVNIMKYGTPNALSGMQLLGTNRWNESGLMDAGDQVEGAVFVDAFFASSQDIGVQQFVDTFRQAYQLTPTVLEAQGFDATRLVQKGIETGGRKPASMRNALAKMANVKGLTGRITFNDNRDAQKQLVLLTVKDGAIVELKK
jgi:ABC-type branched-subunit amino acid transport system substrate-binding protein